MPFEPAKEAGSKPAFGGHAPSELGVDGQYPLDADTDLCYIYQNVKQLEVGYMSYFEMVSPESVGLATERIRRFLAEAERAGLELHRLMILRYGKCCAKVTWAPYGEEDLHPLYSFSKSFTATAVGFAWQEGLLSLDERIVDIFPGEIPADADENLKACTIHHLLCMTCGQETEAWSEGENWRKLFFSHPFLHAPGTFFRYNTAGSNLLSAVILKKTGQQVTEYLRSRLFEPLGFHEVCWWQLPDAEHTVHGGGGMKLCLEDMAKFTQFMLQDGVWEGKQLLKDWFFARAGRLQFPTAGDIEGHVKDWAQGYGYQCWMGTVRDSFRADGAYGQFGLVFPHQALCVIINAATEQTQTILDLAGEWLVPDGSETDPAENGRPVSLTLSLRPLLACRNPVFEEALARSVYTAEPMKNACGLRTLTGGAGLFDVKDNASIGQVRFSFSADSVHLHLKEGNEEKCLKAALNGSFAFSDIDGVRYAATAAWRSTRRLEMEIRRTDALSGVRLIMSFDGEVLRIQADDTLMTESGLGMIKRRIPEFYLDKKHPEKPAANAEKHTGLPAAAVRTGNNPMLPQNRELDWEEVRTEHIVKDEWIDFRDTTFRLPDGHELGPFYTYSRRDYVVIAATDPDGRYICVRQFRQGIREVTTEFPAGGIEISDGPEYDTERVDSDGSHIGKRGSRPSVEEALKAARRELMEETGYESDEWNFVMRIPSNATISDNYAYIFTAGNCRKVAPQNLDDAEFLNVLVLKDEDLEQLIREEKFQQAVHILAWLKTR